MRSKLVAVANLHCLSHNHVPFKFPLNRVFGWVKLASARDDHRKVVGDVSKTLHTGVECFKREQNGGPWNERVMECVDWKEVLKVAGMG